MARRAFHVGKRGGHTWDIGSSRDVLEKLNREFQRLESTVDREELVDHAINFALTAWHLVDWVWRDIDKLREPSRTTLILKLAKGAAVRPQDFGPDGLAKYALRQCPSLAHCQAIATAAKHVRFEAPETGQFVETAVSAANPSEITSEDESLTVQDIISAVNKGWVLKIVIGDERIEAIKIFAGVHGFWHELLYENGIAQAAGEEPC